MSEEDKKTDRTEKSETKKSKKAEVTSEVGAVEKVGDMIRNARIKKKFDIIDVADELRIRKVFLDAIENSDYDVLPGFPYNVGFIKTYAEYLGLSGSRVADLYRSELNIKENRKEVSHEEETEINKPHGKYIIISVLAAVAVYLLWVSFDKYSNKFEEPLTVVETKEVDEDFTLKIEDFSTEVEEKSGVVEVIDLTTGQDIKSDQITVEDGVYIVDDKENTSTDSSLTSKGVEVKLKKQIWFEAKDDKKLYVSKIFEAGNTYKIPDKKGMIISVGDPEAAEVYIDGKLVENVFTRRKKVNIDLDSFIEKARH